MRRALLLGLLFIVASVSTAAAQPYGGRRRDTVWDNKGWTMLGERTVNGRVDRDRIDVGRYEGRFSKLMVVVHDSDLEMLEFRVNFADRTTYDPRLAFYFRENQGTRAFDLPAGENVIKYIEMKYRNLGRDANARVQVWGFRVAAPPPREVTWDQRGWTMLGERTVNGRVDRDRIGVGRYEGRFSKLTVVVHDSDLEMLSFQVNFADGARPYRPAVNHYFRENQRTRVIDLPGDTRLIRDIDITYRNLPGGGNARVQVWGFKEAAPVAFSWDSRGWRNLGEQVVNGRGREDRDRINVNYEEGKFNQLMVVVLDGDIELLEFDVQFNRGDAWRPSVRQIFRESTRTRAIDLPGDRSRRIKYIDMKYRNITPGARARVQIWGR